MGWAGFRRIYRQSNETIRDEFKMSNLNNKKKEYSGKYYEHVQGIPGKQKF